LQIQAEEQGLIVAKYTLEAQEAQIDEAKEALEYTTIRSPIDGVITRINAEVGEMVMTGTMNNPGTVIMIVADLSEMLLVAQIDEADVGKLAVGQEANVRVKAYWDQVYRGIVDNVAMTNDRTQNQTKYYRTEILLQGDVSKLYTGLTADVDIVTQKHVGVIKVLSQAVMARKVDDLPLSIRDNCPEIDPNKTDATVVYRMIDGKAAVTPVTIGPSDLTHIIIRSGLKAGDKVVVGPYKALDGLKHDQLIKDEREAEAEKKKNQQTSEPNAAKPS
jgi:HlyD family secretion protein